MCWPRQSHPWLLRLLLWTSLHGHVGWRSNALLALLWLLLWSRALLWIWLLLLRGKAWLLLLCS